MTWHQVLLTALAGLLFCAVFQHRYAQLPAQFYQARDDGLITLSHARNLVDFGFVGVSPSGDRIEGFSAPLQFLVYAGVYAIARMDYETFGRLQTLLCTFALGALFFRFFSSRPLLGLVLTGAAARFLVDCTSFLEWHGSGMENALTHVFFLALLLVLFRSATEHKVHKSVVPLAMLASLCRVESIYHIAPLLTIFAVYWFVTERSWHGLRVAMVVAAGCVVVNLARLWYFGHALPNTAYGQSISVGARLHSLIAWDRPALLESRRLADLIFAAHGGHLLAAFSPLLLAVRRDGRVVLLIALVASLALSAWVNPFLFGETRLDPTRSTTFLAVTVALAIASVLFFVEHRRLLAGLTPVVAVFTVAAYDQHAVIPRDLCCELRGFLSTGTSFAGLSMDEKLPRPTVANPDLGVISWHKQFNVLDLGKLGSPLFAKLPAGPVLADYFFDRAAPDLIETHGNWSCDYHSSLYTDARFTRRYAPVAGGWGKSDECVGKDLPMGIWMRIDIMAGSGSAERRLIDDLQALLDAPIPAPTVWQRKRDADAEPVPRRAVTSQNTDDAIARLAAEFRTCHGASAVACSYVARTAYRFLPEFIAHRRVRDLRAAFDSSPTREYDWAWLDGYRNGRSSDLMLALLINGK